jgi:uncharacterized membrane protein YphA (DoxX/SURF4 family)
MSHETRDDLAGVYVPLRLTYGLIPVVAGCDKFLNLLTNWEAYLPTSIADLLPVSPTAFMHVVGVVEIVAGLVVLAGLVRIGGFVVAAWLIGIAAVVTIGGDFDIAARDVAMAVGAYTLARIAALRGEEWFPLSTATEGQRAHAGAN